MPKLLRYPAILLFVSLLAACGTFQVGQDFDVNTFASKIERGVTTQAQVRSWLGKPSAEGLSVEADGSRYEQWNYYYAEGKMQDMSTAKMKILQLKFDQQGKVSSYNWSASK